MIIAEAKHKDRRLVRLISESPADLAKLASMPFPFQQDAETGNFLVHLNTVERLLAVGMISGITKGARNRLRKYKKEILTSFVAKDAVPSKKLIQTWSQFFNQDNFQVLPFQIVGMQRTYVRMITWGGGVIIGDDVGLGKTFQTVSVAIRMRKEGRCRKILISTTTGTKHQWGDEIRRISNQPIEIATAIGTAKQRMDKLQQADAQIYIVNHEMIRQEKYRNAIHALLPDVDIIVVDETSKIKNPHSVTHQYWYECIKKVKWCIPLNATAIENSVEDLWAHVRLVDKKSLGSYEGFDKRYVVRSNGYVTGYRKLKELRKRTALNIYRRTRDDVKLQLPKVQTQARYVEMCPKQCKLYEKAVGEAISESSKGAVKLMKLAKVQRAALGDLNQSAKLDDLLELLRGELRSEKVIIFTRFKECVEIVRQALEEFSPLIITGEVSHTQRADNQRRFSIDGGAHRVLIGTEAMDRGLNLQAAGVVINLDLPWNPAKLRQRIGRINRLSQKRASILVINYIATHPKGDTIDQYMISKIIPKRELFRNVLGDADIDELGNESANVEAISEYISHVLNKS